MTVFENEPFEFFEHIYDKWEDGDIDNQKDGEEAVISTILDWGFREMDIGEDLNYLSHPHPVIIEAGRKSMQMEIAESLWAEINKCIDDDGEVILYSERTGDGDGTATFTIAKKEDGVVKLHKAQFRACDYEFAETFEDTPLSNSLRTEMGFKMIPQKFIDANNQTSIEDVMQFSLSSRSSHHWFTNAVWIPQPYNMRFPKWLMTLIREGLTKTKL